MANWLEGKIVENIHWTGSLFSLKIDADILPFTAGQFASLALIIDGKQIARPYSFLNAPHQRPLEFFFYTAIDGLLSNALCKLKPGDAVLIRNRPSGFFVLDEVPLSRDLWMIGTGTGIAPFLSMLNTDRPWQSYQKIILAQGVRTLGDLQYQDVIGGFKDKYGDQFAFQGFVTRETVPGTLQARIPAALADGSLEAAVNCKIEPEHSQVMLCGNPDMVKDVTELLKARGMERNRRRTPGHITAENYW